MSYFKKVLITILLLLLIFLGFVLIQKPSLARNWESGYEKIASISIQNNSIQVSNIRDYHFDGQNITEKNWITRTFDTTKINQVWFVTNPFGSYQGMAHTFFVFDFDNSEPIAVSVEARREVGETYNAFIGLFNKYELMSYIHS